MKNFILILAVILLVSCSRSERRTNRDRSLKEYKISVDLFTKESRIQEGSNTWVRFATSPKIVRAIVEGEIQSRYPSCDSIAYRMITEDGKVIFGGKASSGLKTNLSHDK